MSQDDLDRVRADLAIIKSASVEPAVPREEIGASLIVAGAGAVMAMAVWLVPLAWVRIGVVLAAGAGMAVYLPWKWRIMKRDPPQRRMEVTEAKIWATMSLGAGTYFLFRHFTLRGTANYTEDAWRQEAGAFLMFLVGAGIVASGLIHPTRRHYFIGGMAVIVGAFLLQFTPSVEAAYTILGITAAAACSIHALGLIRLTRLQRGDHGTH